mmetsp:Transcript_31396/g.82587  ORF Transcript_31396/g.82587 Transcript_31396/m.82587 type:complete len:500 (+) Transcript_31396:87-1586(+)
MALSPPPAAATGSHGSPAAFVQVLAAPVMPAPLAGAQAQHWGQPQHGGTSCRGPVLASAAGAVAAVAASAPRRQRGGGRAGGGRVDVARGGRQGSTLVVRAAVSRRVLSMSQDKLVGHDPPPGAADDNEQPPAADISRCYLHRLGQAEAQLLAALRAQVPAAASAAGASSIWGVDILQEGDASNIVLLKFLRAADLDVNGAIARLESTLRFRQERGVDELCQADLGEHFEGHDTVAGCDAEGRPVMISRYGGMDNDKVFGDCEAFVKYRLKIMEQAVSQLSFARGEAEDLCQVHDYSGVPLLFKTSEVKAAIAAMSKVFGDHYPETKGKTIFVNFPAAFSKLFQAFSVFLPERTRKKFLIFGESDQALLFEHLRPEAVPEALGGMLRAGGAIGGTCSAVEVGPRSTEEVVLQEVAGPAAVAWELRVCASEAAYELVFVPADGGAEEVVAASRAKEPLQASSGVVAGEYRAARAGALKCRFRNDRLWLSNRLCLARGSLV